MRVSLSEISSFEVVLKQNNVLSKITTNADGKLGRSFLLQSMNMFL